jgi:hypothetical protein
MAWGMKKLSPGFILDKNPIKIALSEPEWLTKN